MNWLTPTSPAFYKGGTQSVQWYNERITERRKKYPNLLEKFSNYDSKEISNQIKEKGWFKIENFFDLNVLNYVKDATKSVLMENNPDIVRQANGGQHQYIHMPFLNVPAVNKIASDNRIVSIATSFFGCFPGIGTSNLRYSDSKNSIASGTCLYHNDFNSPVKLLKFFIYLNDVDMSNGPFTYVEGSNSKKPLSPFWLDYHRWSDEQIEQLYGKDKIIPLTANYGDLLIATTNGFHKGMPLKQGNRLMLTLNYLVHHELDNNLENLIEHPTYHPGSPYSALHKISKDTYNNNLEIEPLYDFMEKV
tara:strand:+ start:14064 stop:14978 length:915 start_codon:yes stop_codon:yes gene_type:complete